MLTYLDGMKWNCLAQRYLCTSTTTARDFKSFTSQLFILRLWIPHRTTRWPFLISTVWPSFLSCLQCPPLQPISVLWQLCLLCGFSFGTQKMQVESCSVFAAITSCFRVFYFISRKRHLFFFLNHNCWNIFLHQLSPEQKRNIFSDEALFSNNKREAFIKTNRSGSTNVHFLKSNRRLHQFATMYVTKSRCYYPFQNTWKKLCINVLYPRDNILTGAAQKADSRLSLASDCFLDLMSNVCEMSKSLSINYCLQVYSMMNVCCFNLEGYIHKVFAGLVM